MAFVVSRKLIEVHGFAGMADPLSFVLGNGGYRAYKYVPWGRVEEVMPYLIRRAQVLSSKRATRILIQSMPLYGFFLPLCKILFTEHRPALLEE